jgi:hypothetical protein
MIAVKARFAGPEQAMIVGCSISHLAQALGCAQEAGFGIILWRTSLLPIAIRSSRSGRQARREVSQSQTGKMGLNPSFFKAGAGGGEV